MIKVIHDSKRITLSGRRKDRPKTLPLYKFFEEEELTPEDQAEWNTYTAGLKQGKEKVENKDAKEYTEEEKKELFKLGLSGKNIVAKLKFNKIACASISQLPPGTIIIYRMPWRQSKKGVNVEPDKRPTVKANFPNINDHPGKTALMQVTYKFRDKDFDVPVADPDDFQACGLKKPCVVRCNKVCYVDNGLTIYPKQVAGSFNNIHTADIWDSIKHNCDKMTQDDLEVYGDDEYQEGDEMTNESIDENDQVVAYVVMP